MIKIDTIRIKKDELIVSWRKENNLSFGQICIYFDVMTGKYRLDSENLSKDSVKEIFNSLINILELDVV